MLPSVVNVTTDCSTASTTAVDVASFTAGSVKISPSTCPGTPGVGKVWFHTSVSQFQMPSSPASRTWPLTVIGSVFVEGQNTMKVRVSSAFEGSAIV